MILLDQLEAISSPSGSCGLTIGAFDGVHRGHQRILKRLREKVGEEGTLCVVTFKNHPSHVLPHRKPVPLIFSNNLKIKMLEKMGVDVLYSLEFTPEVARIPYDQFLREVKRAFPFDFLVLGEGASFGYKGQGTPERVVAMEEELEFSAEYLSKLSQEEKVVSSGTIRKCILEGDLKRAAALLGHPFMIEVSNKLKMAPHICIPADGRYRAIAKQDFHEIPSTVSFEKGNIIIDAPIKDKETLLIFQ